MILNLRLKFQKLESFKLRGEDRNEAKYSPSLSVSHGDLRVREHLPNPLYHRGLQGGNLQPLPPVLHRQAETGRHCGAS